MIPVIVKCLEIFPYFLAISPSVMHIVSQEVVNE